jgi:hypothetical protein
VLLLLPVPPTRRLSPTMGCEDVNLTLPMGMATNPSPEDSVVAWDATTAVSPTLVGLAVLLPPATAVRLHGPEADVALLLK